MLEYLNINYSVTKYVLVLWELYTSISRHYRICGGPLAFCSSAGQYGRLGLNFDVVLARKLLVKYSLSDLVKGLHVSVCYMLTLIVEKYRKENGYGNVDKTVCQASVAQKSQPAYVQWL